ncbi:hypothetical protein IW261DRAFT_1565798 [Armillaria novae-zelandiae]|uniref:Uncharacterized protein n=1 Tax=Armillaria novae-zelandiae TaxID=153914 RepID=A0AA39U4U2_9AGAR|nr:hypothetical protein IW261DRAFT_1565798 [Armillaria novae-zelandiae]
MTKTGQVRDATRLPAFKLGRKCCYGGKRGGLTETTTIYAAEFGFALEVENGIEACISADPVARQWLPFSGDKVARDVEGGVDVGLKSLRCFNVLSGVQARGSAVIDSLTFGGEDVGSLAGNEEAIILCCGDLRSGHRWQWSAQATWWGYRRKDRLPPLIHITVMTSGHITVSAF